MTDATRPPSSELDSSFTIAPASCANDEQIKPASETSGSVDGDNSNENQFLIAEKENKAVIRGRFMFIGALLAAAAGAACLTYSFTSRAEKNEFENDFGSYASEITNAINRNAKVATDSYAGFAATITANAVSNELEWPNVAMPFLTRLSIHTQITTGSVAVSFAPLLRTTAELEQYEAFSSEIMEQFIADNMRDVGVPVANDTMLTPYVFSVEKHADVAAFPPPGGWPRVKEDSPPWAPIAGGGPAIPYMLLAMNADVLSFPENANIMEPIDRSKKPILTDVYVASDFGGGALTTNTEPTCSYMIPVMSNFTDDAIVAGLLLNPISWTVFLSGLLGEGIGNINVVISTSCGSSFTYLVQGPTVTFLGMGSMRERKFRHLKQSTIIEAFRPPDGDYGLCTYSIEIYPTQDFHDSYMTSTPFVFTTIVTLVFALTSLVFVGYDKLVQRRQEKVMNSAAKTDAIVSELFPSEFRDRLFHNRIRASSTNKLGAMPQKGTLTGSNVTNGAGTGGSPVADLFPHTTVMFADIQGFTAWSSMREPTHVFTLLEAVYSSFDRIAKRRKIFKVETVGDCYVAVAGLPTPRPDHAVIMARFSRECVVAIQEVVCKLELFLGPGTGNLGMRFGLHSGPTTAGVLRGEKARFQLFGDTVNTAARIESTGLPNRIQLSQQTADQLVARNKAHWVKPREDVVFAKGKGELRTFWLCDNDGDIIQGRSTITELNQHTSVSNVTTKEQQADLHKARANDQTIQRLVDWNTTFLLRLLKQVVASRDPHHSNQSIGNMAESRLVELESTVGLSDTVLDEMMPVVELPDFAHRHKHSESSPVDLPIDTEKQMKDFITLIAASYRGNPFHNFEHASHVAMSVHKLLSRIVAPKRPDIIHEMDGTNQDASSRRGAEELHDHTYGITSDPLTQFAVVLSALIHDVDHRGVSNAQLIAEDAELGKTYKNKSVAEQNSVDVAWGMLMANRFKALRRCIYTNGDEMRRFRQIIVNSVLATDIFDKELGALRKNRWNLAFANGGEQADSTRISTSTSTSRSTSSSSLMDMTGAIHSIDRNRKATIVIEHIIQASDVAHTMQHWHVYQAWNERLFSEMHEAYKQGRAEKNPADGWYKGELWFFDNYVIPLAGKLESCGVFGVSSDECLDYAKANREEWARKGQNIVAGFVEKYCVGDLR